MHRKKHKNLKNTYYPSAELIQSACYEDYKRLIDTYDKIYDKINMALAFCGIVLLVIIGSFDYTVFFEFAYEHTMAEMFVIIVKMLSSTLSTFCITWAVIQLLFLIRSQKISVFDSIAARNLQVYKLPLDQAALWLIDKYTIATVDLKGIINKKQKKFNSAITKVIISILAYALLIIL